MVYQLPQPVVILFFFLSLLAAFYVGAWLKKIISRKEGPTKGVTIFIESTLLSLLLGFAYNTAATKSFARKEFIITELNSISTTYSRAKLYPDSISKILKNDIRNYAISRTDYYRAGSNEDKISIELATGDSIGTALMDKVALYAKDPANSFYTQQMVPAVNTMVDNASTREFQRTNRIPLASIKMLVLVSLLVSFLNGTNSKPDRVRFFGAIGFSLIVSITLYLILDLDSTREGFIRPDKEEIKIDRFINKITTD